MGSLERDQLSEFAVKAVFDPGEPLKAAWSRRTTNPIDHRLPFLLFVIADGYTFPVERREDLVRHGYLRAE